MEFYKKFNNASSLLLSNNKLLFPLSKNSFGPFLQLLEIINKLFIAALLKQIR